MLRVLLITAFAALLGLTACSEEESGIRIGSKNFGESRIMAEMMVAIIEEQGLRVDGVVEYETTPMILEALKRGDIDAYPEYNGTGLVMLGQNPVADGDAATEQVKAVFEPLGIAWRERVGFANNYGLAMLPTRADELGAATMSDLSTVASDLTLGIESDFDNRPLDGLTPMTQRYGYGFGAVEEVSLDDRGQLYDMLLEGDVDVIEVYTTDGQLADYGLVVLEDDLGFFPVYELAPIVRADALAAHGGLGGALDALGGQITEDEIQTLNRRVELEGRSARAVARDFLARKGLISSGAVEAQDPLVIATSPYLADSAIANRALRAARRAYQGREVAVDATHDPLAAVATGEARMALVGAESFFDISKPSPVRDERFESVAAVGTNLIHLVSKTGDGGVSSLAAADEIAVGPEGSSSYELGMILKDGLDLKATLVPTESNSLDELMGALDGSANIVLLSVPAGTRGLIEQFDAGGLTLLPLKGWNTGPNLVKFPFLRSVRIPANTYALQLLPIDTLSSQVVLAGPALTTSGDAVGEQGPGATAAASLKPIPDSTMNAMAESMDGGMLVDPVLKTAAAFSPTLPEPPAPMNPSADVSILNLLITFVLIWLFWLYTRPEYR